MLNDDNKSACNVDDDVSFCYSLRTSLYLRLTFKSAIASQLVHIAPPPPDPVCSYPSLQLLEPVTTLEVSKLLSTIPPKSCCLGYIPTAIIKQCSSVLSELIAYLANLSFSQGSFLSDIKNACVTPLLKKPGLEPGLCLQISDLYLI